MKITNVSTNPEMKIHFQKPVNPTSFDYNSTSSALTIIYSLIFVIAILSTLLFFLFTLILLIVWLLRARKQVDKKLWGQHGN
jgi:ABC-type transport system involved in Fe-S cluster assembly fused permease/ATPase subunit